MKEEIRIRIEGKSWKPSILKKIQENKYVAILPYTDVVTRQRRFICENVVEEVIDEDFLEENEDVLVEIEDNDEIEGIIEEKTQFEIIDTYWCEFDFRIFLNWIQVGKYLIPANQFREILEEEDRITLHREFHQIKEELRCIIRGTSTKDLLIQKELLGIKYPVPIKITKQLEKEIKSLNKKEQIAFGRTIKSYNLRDVDWNVMTIRKINLIAKSLVSFSKEESRLSLRKLKELEKEKMEKELETKEILALIEEDPKAGSKLLDKMGDKIKPFYYQKEGFTLRTPKNYMELYNEGLRMQNCIGVLHLAPIFLKKETPLFLERKGVIVAHLLLNKDNGIEEVRMKKNRNPNKVIEDFVENFAKEFKLKLEFKKQYGYNEEGFRQPF